MINIHPMTIMKTYLLPLIAILSTVSISAEELSDSIADIRKPSSVTVISRADSKKIIVKGREGDPDYYLEYESAPDDNNDIETIEESWFFNPLIPKKNQKIKKIRRDPVTDEFCDVYAGVVIPTGADRGMDRTGLEIGMLNLVRARWRLSKCGTELSAGLGFQYRPLTVGDGLMADRSDNGALILKPIPEGYTDVKSSIKSFSLQIPLLLRQKIYKDFTIEAGAVAMFNTYTTASCRWDEEYVTTDKSLKNLHQRIFTVDGVARIGWRGDFAFYVRYSPTQFKSVYGPQYRSIAVGLSLGF